MGGVISGLSVRPREIEGRAGIERHSRANDEWLGVAKGFPVIAAKAAIQEIQAGVRHPTVVLSGTIEESWKPAMLRSGLRPSPQSRKVRLGARYSTVLTKRLAGVR